jgi:hypothetical protein
VIDEVRGLLDEYAQWLRDKSVLREVNDRYVEITTPYLDRHNDYTQIYVRRDNGGFVLTDGGETIQDLRASGCDLETSKPLAGYCAVGSNASLGRRVACRRRRVVRFRTRFGGNDTRGVVSAGSSPSNAATMAATSLPCSRAICARCFRTSSTMGSR